LNQPIHAVVAGGHRDSKIVKIEQQRLQHQTNRQQHQQQQQHLQRQLKQLQHKNQQHQNQQQQQQYNNMLGRALSSSQQNWQAAVNGSNNTYGNVQTANLSRTNFRVRVFQNDRRRRHYYY